MANISARTNALQLKFLLYILGNMDVRRRKWPTLQKMASGYVAARASKTGEIIVQGPHHDALKSTTTSFPFVPIRSSYSAMLLT